MIEEYKTARKLGQKQVKKALAADAFPYPTLLDDALEGKVTVGEKRLGIMDIPLSLVIGVKESSRSVAFSSGFMPLLDEFSEFAHKWCRLYEAQINEGIRDAVVLYEYMNRYYIQEGNKRVSVLKYMKQPLISADVIRILPEVNDSKESRKYYEYVRFYDLTGISSILFSETGSYDKLLTLVGKNWEDPWEYDEIKHLKNIYFYFANTYKTLNGEFVPEITGDAFLRFLSVFPYNEFAEKTGSKVEHSVKRMNNELSPDALAGEVELVMNPDEQKNSFVGKIIPAPRKKLKVGFLYQEGATTSGWAFFHDKGRRYVVEQFGERLETVVMENVSPGEETETAIQTAIDQGCTLIFTTTASMMQATMKKALSNPDILFFNCSLNFPYKMVRTYSARIYEAKFLAGIIAGTLAADEMIGYEAYYPVYGEIANINAFALGVQLVNPLAKIRLYWNLDKHAHVEHAERLFFSKEENFISRGTKSFGLYSRTETGTKTYAAALIDWGKFYEHIIQLVLEGTWKKVAPKATKNINYWWGFSAGVLEIVYTNDLPAGTKKLVNSFQRFITEGVFHPFEGVIRDRDGVEHGAEGEVLDVEEIVAMDWLCENIEGEIPSKSEMTENDIHAMAELEVKKTEKVFY